MMTSTPRPRPGIYDLYWTFAYERHRTFERRVEGLPGPWTDDPIIQTYKFCNTYRAADRVSQYLIREVAYSHEQVEPEDLVFQIVAFRTFSKIATWERLRDTLGRAPIVDDLADGSFENALNQIKQAHGGLYTGAFILCATDAFGRQQKHLNHVELFKYMFIRNALSERVLEVDSLRDLYQLLHSFPLMGDFMSYQIAIDLNYTAVVNFSENDFTQPGPGAVRGLRKVFEDLGGLGPADAINWMVDHQEAEFDRLGLPFRGLWGRPIQAIDAQNLFCETDKYCREAAPHLASARSKIKAKYSTKTADPIVLMFPPKWGINHKLPIVPVLGSGRPLAQPALF